MNYSSIVIIVLLAVIGLDLGQATYDHDLEFTEDEFQTLMDMMEDSENERDVRLSNWFKKAFNSAKDWTKKAASDAGKWTKKAASDAGKWTKKAVKDAGKAIKKGCGYVNEIPVKELVYHRTKEMTEEEFMSDVDEAQLAAAYNALKSGCKIIGK
ncbi:uncharacterized protein LOC129258509 [Lytechinus pictus]|uniref:uncharacterized protein LOC121412595 n=1 Tax=Lytechinus variegatus TaxID=7654 RepID=UPI001BB10E8E|nr:uncharacterized protein LOC121412595 [Lytechinus variegatus]XP_054752742.1 uncharacterized protein LOC129258509 [Lytechinus pictus]